MPWPVNKSLRASINNFGYGGTNAQYVPYRHSSAPRFRYDVAVNLYV